MGSLFRSIATPAITTICRATSNDFEWLFKQFSIVFAAFKYAHLMDGDLIKLDQTFLLWHPLFNKHRIEILHIGETY